MALTLVHSSAPKPTVSPEVQHEYDDFMNDCYLLLYGERFQRRLDTLRTVSAEDPVAGLTAIVSLIVKRLKDSAQATGKAISGPVLRHGGTELLEDLADLSEKAGIYTFSEDEIEAALDMLQRAGPQSGNPGSEAVPRRYAFVSRSRRIRGV